MLKTLYKMMMVSVSTMHAIGQAIMHVLRRGWAIQLFALGTVVSLIKFAFDTSELLRGRMLLGMDQLFYQLGFYDVPIQYYEGMTFAKWDKILPISEMLQVMGMLITTWIVCLGYRLIKSWIPTVS